MNRQTSKLLNILLNSPGQYFHYEELAARFQVSTRSIRNYTQSILDFLEDLHMPSALTVSEGGIAFTGGAEESSLLLQAAVDNDFYLYRLSPEERSHIILLNLLISDDYCNIYDLSEKFNVSRTTILKDMEQVKAFLARYNCTFDPAMNRGYLLRLREQQRRDMIVRIIQTAMGAVFSLHREVNVYERFLYEEWSLETYFPFLRQLLLEMEHQYNLDVSDACFEELLLTLAIITVRMEKGFCIQESTLEEKTFQNLLVYELAENILKELEDRYRLSCSEAEVQYLASKLYYCRFYASAPIEDAQDVKLHMALTSFLMMVSSQLNIPIYEDAKIVNQLESHLRDIDKAHAEGVLLENDYTDQMIGEYPEYYQLICRHLSILENISGYSYTKDDIAVILIYLVVAVERHFKNDILPKVIVVCHTGIGTANFLAERLNTYFHIRIMAVTSNHRLADVMKNYDFDVIISTVTLKEPEDLWIKVSPMLEDEDILRLQKLFMDIKRNKKKLGTPNQLRLPAPGIRTVLREENILLDVCCTDWKEVIQKAAEPLLTAGSIDTRYIDAMIRSYETNGAYFVYCPGVALAHAGPEDGVRFFGLSLIRLKKPVSFGHRQHDPVAWCICLAIQEKDEQIQEVLRLMNLLGNPEKRPELDAIACSGELLQYIMENE